MREHCCLASFNHLQNRVRLRQGFIVAEEAKDLYLARVLEAWQGTTESF